jgi:hypothetical protein
MASLLMRRKYNRCARVGSETGTNGIIELVPQTKIFMTLALDSIPLGQKDIRL